MTKLTPILENMCFPEEFLEIRRTAHALTLIFCRQMYFSEIVTLQVITLQAHTLLVSNFSRTSYRS
jgi:hypothetical protein